MTDEEVVEKAQARPVSALHRHAMSVWKHLWDNSVDDVTEHGERVRVWTGFITAEFGVLDIPTTYYTQVMRLLKAVDCIHQLQRGGNNTPSAWAVLREPTEEALSGLRNRTDAVHGKKSKTATLEQQMRDLSARVGTLELEVENLKLEIRVLNAEKVDPIDNL